MVSPSVLTWARPAQSLLAMVGLHLAAKASGLPRKFLYPVQLPVPLPRSDLIQRATRTSARTKNNGIFFSPYRCLVKRGLAKTGFSNRCVTETV